MGLNCLFSVPSGMNHVGPRGVSVVCRLFVMSRVVMLGGFPVVAGGMRQMFRGFLVVLRSFLRHMIFSVGASCLGKKDNASGMSRLFKIALTAGLTLRQFVYPTYRTELGVRSCEDKDHSVSQAVLPSADTAAMAGEEPVARLVPALGDDAVL